MTSGRRALIDDIAVNTRIAAAVPEPGSCVLLGVA
jgi:hypothetical protein